MNRKFPTAEHKELFEAISKLNNPELTAKFFRDLLTEAELDEFANRWQMVKLLYLKKYSYAQIAKILNTSTTTVTRVAYWLNRGTGGYQEMAKKMFL